MIRVELIFDGAVAEIVLDRPEKLNALDVAMVRELAQRLDEAVEGRSRALILRGEGRGFCAGRDIGEADPRREDAKAIIDTFFNPVIRRIVDFPAPTFAAVHGACVGAGLGLALACDVVHVADDARLGSPFARLGATPDSGAHLCFVERLGPHRALELIYSGRLVSGSEAAALGLVNTSMAGSDLLDTVRLAARQAAAGPTAAFVASKRLVRRISEESLGFTAALEAESFIQGEMSKTADYIEGFVAFQEKREPRFVGA